MNELIVGYDEGIEGGDMTAAAVLCRSCNGLVGVQLFTPGDTVDVSVPTEGPYCHAVYDRIRVIKED